MRKKTIENNTKKLGPKFLERTKFDRVTFENTVGGMGLSIRGFAEALGVSTAIVYVWIRVGFPDERVPEICNMLITSRTKLRARKQTKKRSKS